MATPAPSGGQTGEAIVEIGDAAVGHGGEERRQCATGVVGGEAARDRPAQAGPVRRCSAGDAGRVPDVDDSLPIEWDRREKADEEHRPEIVMVAADSARVRFRGAEVGAGRRRFLGRALRRRDERRGQPRPVDRRESRKHAGHRQPDLGVGFRGREALEGVERESAHARLGRGPFAQDGVDRPGIGEEPEGPGADGRRGVVEERPEPWLADATDPPQGPQGAEPKGGCVAARDEVFEPRHDLVELAVGIPGGVPVSEEVGCHSGMPAIGGEEPDEGRGVEGFQIGTGRDRGGQGVVCHEAEAVDPAARPMDPGPFVAFAGVAPVEDRQGLPRQLHKVGAAEEGIAEPGQVGLMAPDDAGRLGIEPVDVDAPAVEIEREESTAEGLRPARLVRHDQAAGVGMAAAVGIGPAIARLGPVPPRIEVVVVGVGPERLDDPGMGLDGVGAGVMGAGKHAPQVTIDGVGEETVAEVVPVEPPGIRRAVADRLEDLPLRMISPDAAAERHALVGGAAGCADLAGGAGATAAVKPAIGAPCQPVGEGVVAVGRDGEAVENGNRGGSPPGRLVGVGGQWPSRWRTMAVGDEEETRGAEEPQATAAHRHTREPLEPVDERRLPLRAAVAIDIFEHRHPIAEARVCLERLLGVGEVFGNDHPAGCIDARGDRIADRRFGSKQTKPWGQPRLNRGERLVGMKWFTGPLGVVQGRLGRS